MMSPFSDLICVTFRLQRVHSRSFDDLVASAEEHVSHAYRLHLDLHTNIDDASRAHESHPIISVDDGDGVRERVVGLRWGLGLTVIGTSRSTSDWQIRHVSVMQGLHVAL